MPILLDLKKKKSHKSNLEDYNAPTHNFDFKEKLEFEEENTHDLSADKDVKIQNKNSLSPNISNFL